MFRLTNKSYEFPDFLNRNPITDIKSPEDKVPSGDFFTCSCLAAYFKRKSKNHKMDRVRKLVSAKEVYKQGYSGNNVCIAVLDTGVYAAHPDFGGRIVCFRDYVNHRTGAYDDNGHGTHIGGILCGNGKMSGGRYAGMAGNAKLVVLKVLDQNGNGNTTDVIRALEWVHQNREKYRIRLLNFSVGFLPGAGLREQKELLDAIDRLWDEDIAVVTAAGNNGPGAQTVTVPGISRKVITVGASDDAKSPAPLVRGYSGTGPTGCCIVKPEILAPGTNVRSLSNRPDTYTVKSGTSMAAPVVCGALALALEKRPQMTPAELKLALYETVTPPEVPENTKAWGILHVDKLLQVV
jgi:serine protease AprX